MARKGRRGKSPQAKARGPVTALSNRKLAPPLSYSSGMGWMLQNAAAGKTAQDMFVKSGGKSPFSRFRGTGRPSPP